MPQTSWTTFMNCFHDTLQFKTVFKPEQIQRTAKFFAVASSVKDSLQQVEYYFREGNSQTATIFLLLLLRLFILKKLIHS